MENIVKKLNEINPGKVTSSVLDDSFRRFGAIHEGFKIDGILKYLSKNKIKDGITYIPDVPEMRDELSEEFDPILFTIYAGLDAQTGIAFGRSDNTLNAFEYHHGSELFINATDMVMLLGLEQDIKWPEGTYDSSLAEAFYSPGGSVIELRGGCLHYVPANVSSQQGLNLVVCLLKGTNSPIDLDTNRQGRDSLITAKNSWFIAHPEYEQAKNAGRYIGIKGENLIYRTF